MTGDVARLTDANWLARYDQIHVKADGEPTVAGLFTSVDTLQAHIISHIYSEILTPVVPELVDEVERVRATIRGARTSHALLQEELLNYVNWWVRILGEAILPGNRAGANRVLETVAAPENSILLGRVPEKPTKIQAQRALQTKRTHEGYLATNQVMNRQLTDRLLTASRRINPRTPEGIHQLRNLQGLRTSHQRIERLMERSRTIISQSVAILQKYKAQLNATTTATAKHLTRRRRNRKNRTQRV